MDVKLNIDKDPDAKTIKNLLEIGFNKGANVFVFAFETENKGTFSMKSPESQNLIREQFIKPFFEMILMGKGEYKCHDMLEELLDEIGRGE